MSEKILFYYPSNKRSIAFNKMVTALVEEGYNVNLFTTCDKGLLHEDFEAIGVESYTAKPLINKLGLGYLFNLFNLVLYCYKFKPDIILSHLQQANIIAIFAQYFVNAKVIPFRHHFRYDIFADDVKLKPSFTEKVFDFLINKLSRQLIVPSRLTKGYLIKNESVSASKVSVLPYVYDFNTYETIYDKADNLRQEKYPCKLLLLYCSRLIPYKRPLLVVELMNRLVKHHQLDVKLIMLDEGSLKDQVLENIDKLNLKNHVFYVGYSTQFAAYMKASDILIHPSLTEASSSTVKEMACFGKTVAVIDGVGDFNEYIENGKNGFLIPGKNSIGEFEKLVLDIYNNKYDLEGMGKKLKQAVTDNYSFNKNYTELLKKILV